MSKFAPILAALALSLGTMAHAAPAKPSPIVYVCKNLQGAYMGPQTRWKIKSDGYSDQKTIITFNPSTRETTADWYFKDKMYSSVAGKFFYVQGGYLALSVSDNDIETYTVDALTLDLMFTQTRINDLQLPNAVKSVRGECSQYPNRTPSKKHGPWELNWK